MQSCDFAESVNGPVTSKWGTLRTKHGHPAPYNLTYKEFDDEKRINRGYIEDIKKKCRDQPC